MVSVVIATHNGAKDQVSNLISSINASTYKDIEIIIHGKK